MRFPIYENQKQAVFYTEKGAETGLVKIAGKVLADAEKITSQKFELRQAGSVSELKGESVVLFANSAVGSLLQELEAAGKLSLEQIKGKWEVFGYFAIEKPWEGTQHLLVIAGSDKRGSIYGMFELSEKMGISPLYYISDSVIPKKENLSVEVEDMVSKEPSVQYRGFFINDEWPCFGNWTFSHFGGFTAEMYDHIFELLLRLKGNYLWPAMWTSSFALDGPGEASYELADEYGIVIGNSHHEPCLRASEEWDKVRGKDSIYGNAWNFLTNREGLLKYWEDGLARSARLESMVTIGMRGERDSKVMGEDATLQDNIELLKDIIHCQKELIRKEEEKNRKTLPKLLALYKEVEPYFYGDEKTPGLCDWEELEDVILMLCEDNHGYMRTLPDEKMRRHPGGYGMYYHVDYHGGPVSYEWVNSTPLSQIWEQMCKAYDTGVRKVWILNVGDLKFNEFPLAYFLKLAYDFEGYGTKNPGKERVFTRKLLARHLGDAVSEELVEEAAQILTESVRMAGLRRPEALNPKVYHPFHYGEADRMEERAGRLAEREEAFAEKLKQIGEEQWNAWRSLAGYSVQGIANHILLNLYAAKNEAYAQQGRKEANFYGEAYQQCVGKNSRMNAAFASFLDGKWHGMEGASHIGFTKWNEDGCRYPIRHIVTPFERARMQVSLQNDSRVYDKVYGSPMRIRIEDFCYPENEEVKLCISNTGIGELKYEIRMGEQQWLQCDACIGLCSDGTIVTFMADKEKMTKPYEEALVRITDGDTVVEALFCAQKQEESQAVIAMNTFLPGQAGIIMDAAHYAVCKAPQPSYVQVLEDYGIVGSAVKFYPDDAMYTEGSEPALTYRFYSPKVMRDAVVELWFAPSNPMRRDGRMKYGIAINGLSPIYDNVVPTGYMAGENSDITWCRGALTRRHVCKMNGTFSAGKNSLTVYLTDAGLVLERIMIYEKDKAPKASYLGPKESIRMNG